MRRVASFFILLVLICAMFSGTALAAEPQFTGSVAAKYYLLADADSGVVLASSGNESEKMEPASTTKVMTLLVALEKGNMNDEVTISGHAAGMGGSSCHLKQGNKVKMQNLLTAMMMVSGNDAATAVAEHIGGGNEQAFIDMMNAKAQELGMKDTHFVTPHGMHKEDHYSTLNDMKLLACAAMKNSAFMDIVDRASFTLPENNVEYKNTNFLLKQDGDTRYPYANGMKTGSTNEAGACLVASASKDNMNLICLLYKDTKTEDGRDRWPDAKELFDYGFNTYSSVKLSDILKDAQPVQIPVENCAASDSGILEFPLPGDDTYVTLSKTTADGLVNGSDKIKEEHLLSSGGTTLQAPVKKDEVLGSVAYKSENTGETIFSGMLVAPRDVLQAGTESNVNGDTAVTKMPAMIPETLKEKDNHASRWLLLLIPAGLIGFLVFRLLTQNHKRRKRFAPRKKPQYSYKIRR